MIAAIRGVLEQRGVDHVVVAVGGVSLRVFAPVTTLDGLPPTGQQVRLHTSLLVREEEVHLYGFATEEGRRLFDMLIAVSSVGPRLALAVLSAMTPEQAALAIASGDADALSRAPGVGKKTAQRVILELRGRLEQEWGAAAPAAAGDGADAVTALLALGYTPAEARQALAGEDRPELPLDERVRRALQRMAGG